jgi:hypothetical protein
MRIAELCTVIGLIGSSITGVVFVVRHFDEKFESIDGKFASVNHKIDNVNHRLDNMEGRLDNIEIELKKTSNLLNNYLTWRFLYVHDPKRKNIEPRYDPNEKTLEFVDKGGTKSE